MIDLTSQFADLARDGGRETTTRLGGQEVRLVRFAPGAGQWHAHSAVDETVLVWGGAFQVEYRDRTDTLTQGQVCVVPAGTEHRGASADGAEIVLFKVAA